MITVRQIFWLNLLLDVFIAWGTVAATAVMLTDTWTKLLVPAVVVPALLGIARAIQSAIRNVKTDLESPKSMQPVDVSIFGKTKEG